MGKERDDSPPDSTNGQESPPEDDRRKWLDSLLGRFEGGQDSSDDDLAEEKEGEEPSYFEAETIESDYDDFESGEDGDLDPEAAITLDLAEDPLGRAAHESLVILHSAPSDASTSPEGEFDSDADSGRREHDTPTIQSGPRLSDALDINAVMFHPLVDQPIESESPGERKDETIADEPVGGQEPEVNEFAAEVETVVVGPRPGAGMEIDDEDEDEDLDHSEAETVVRPMMTDAIDDLYDDASEAETVVGPRPDAVTVVAPSPDDLLDDDDDEILTSRPSRDDLEDVTAISDDLLVEEEPEMVEEFVEVDVSPDEPPLLPEAVEAVEGEAVEGEAVEGEAVEGEAVEGEAVEGEAVEGEAVEGEAVEGEAVEADRATVPSPLDRAKDLAAHDDLRHAERWLTAELEVEAGEEQQAALYFQLGRVRELLGEDQTARQSYKDAARMDPRFRPAALALRHELLSSEQWHKVLKILDAQIRAIEAPRHKAELLLEKGWILEDQLQNLSEAKECYWAAHVADKSWLAPLLAIERQLIVQGDLGGLGDVYARMAEVLQDPEQKVAVLRDLARLQTQLRDGTPEQALEYLRQALQIDSSDRRALLYQMELVALQAGLHEEHISVLVQLGEDGTEEQRAGFLRQAAMISRHELKQVDRSFELINQAIELCPDDPTLRQQQLSLAEQTGDWTLVTKLLRTQCDATEDTRQRAGLLHRLALAYERAGEVELAERAIDETLELLPGYLPELVDRERRAISNGNWTALVNVVEQEARAVASGSRGLPAGAAEATRWQALTWWRAAVLHRLLGEPDEAINACRQALAASPEDRLVRQELVDLLWQQKRHEELAATLQEQLAGVEEASDERRRTLEMLLALYDGPLNDTEVLLDLYRKLLSGHPDDSRIQNRFAAALWRAEEYQELDRVLSDLEQDASEESPLQSFRLQRARLYGGVLGRPDEAVALYQQVLDAAPSHPYALNGLERLLRREGRLEELASVLRDAARDCTVEQQQTQLFLKLARLYEIKLQRPGEAHQIYSELLAQDPENQAALRAVAATAWSAGDQAKLADALEMSLERMNDPLAAAAVSVRLAEVLQYGLGEPDRAEEYLNNAVGKVDLDEQLPTPVRTALEWLVRKQIVRGDFLEAQQNMARLAAAAPSEVRPWLLSERAWINADVLGDVEQARALYAELADSSSGNTSQLWWAQLHAAARQREAGGLSAALGRLASDCREVEQAGPLLTRAGLLAAANGEPQQAAEFCRQALAYDADNAEALLLLLGDKNLPADEAADFLGRVKSQLPERLAGQLRLPLANALLKAGQLSDASVPLGELLDEDPDNVAALVLLQRLAHACGDQLQESRVWVKLSTLFSDPNAKAETLRRGGQLLESLGHRMSDSERLRDAAVIYRQVLPLQPNDKYVFEQLRRLYQDLGDDRGLDELISHRIAQAEENAPDLGKLLLERAELRLQKLRDPRAAARDLLRVLELDNKNPEALRQLASLYDEDGNATRAVELYHRLAEQSDTLSLKRGAILRMSELLDAHGRTADAIETCRHFLELAPDDDTALERLAEMHVRVKDYSHAVQTLEKLGNLRSDRQWRSENMRRIARIYWEEMNELQQARAMLLSTQDLDPTNLDVLDDLRRVSLQMGLTTEDLHRLMERAKDDVRDGLSSDPLDVNLYRKLMKIAEWDEDKYTLLAALGVLCFLNAADSQDRKLYLRRADAISFEPKRSLQAQAWREALVSGAARGAYGEIWSVIASGVAKLYDRIPGDAKALGVSRGDRVSRKAGGPVSSTIDRIASAFGMGEFDIYLSQKDPQIVAGVGGDKDLLVVGHAVVSSLDAAQRFRIGRTLSLLRDKALAVELLGRSEVALLLGAAVFHEEPNVVLDVPRDKLEQTARRLHKAMSRKARKALPLAVSRFLQEGGEVDEWINGVLATANRAGLLVCGDVLMAMEQLSPGPENRKTKETAALVEALRPDLQASQLLLYSVSHEYLSLRRELQL